MPSAQNHDHHTDHGAAPPQGAATAVLDVSGLHWASEKAVVDTTLRRLDGVKSVDANPVGQTATVTYDPAVTNVAELRRWVEKCGYHCAGQSVPDHVCDPMEDPAPHGHAGHAGPSGDVGHAPEHEGHAAAETAVRSPHEVMGHGGHGGASMADMVADMRRRFIVAAVLSVPILLWSPIGRDVL
ncbi:MAG TPA: heavy-metal-associated domain-containing protein, partial [Ilumatobacteraceae bacterium]|nr:heavy-metal-associated domain-containing protein [Ilumatobacteraceae bacterium]